MTGNSTLSYILLSLVIGYVFIYPYVTKIPALNEQKQRYLSALETVSSIESKISQLRSQYESIPNESKERINTILPNSFNFVRIISQIDNVASKYGISIDEISYQESYAPGNSVESAQMAGPYESTVIGFSFTTSYGSFQDFIDELEKSLRVLDVRSVELDSDDKGTHTFKVELETYWLKE